MAKPTDKWRERRDFSARPLLEQVKDLFALHKGERRGTAALVLLLAALLGAVVYQQWLRPPVRHDMTALRADMEAWLAQRDSASRAAGTATMGEAELFRFDPNTISTADWQRLGLTQRQAEGVERFRTKGGRFRTRSDVARMYTISAEQYARLEPYIDLPDSLPRKGRGDGPRGWKEREGPRDEEPRVVTAQEKQDRGAPQVRRKVEVNTADTAALIALPGIGPSFARGIVKYRESLGGYHSLEQLGEVYVLKDKPDALARIKELLTVDTLAIRRVPLNTCTVEELAAHPYARWRIAKPVIAYRQQHGPFTRIDELLAIPVLDAEGLRKLAPYLSLE